MSVVDYDPRWPEAYASERSALHAVLGDLIVRAHHIGSTAVAGVAAKPVIDILLEVRDLGRLDAMGDAMRAIGYRPRGELGIPGRRYFSKGGDARTHHIHAFVSSDPHIGEHLAFRDYLRAHAYVASAYARIKQEAADRYRHDPDGYVRCKHAFVARTVREAIVWAARQA